MDKQFELSIPLKLTGELFRNGRGMISNHCPGDKARRFSAGTRREDRDGMTGFPTTAPLNLS
jgi:hypothetical protein